MKPNAAGAFRLLCVIAILLAGLVALALDGQVLHRQILLTGSIIPGDLLRFRLDAWAALHPGIGVADRLPYPPPFLLLSVPMFWLPPLAGYLAWVLAGNALLVAVARAMKISWGAVALGLVSASNLYCMAMGQTGAFVSAALILSLGLAQARPVLAGVAAGCLIIKPQFAVLLPVCYLAARNWRAFFAAAGTVAGLCLLTELCFGNGIWAQYFVHHASAGKQLLNAGWPQTYQYSMVTVFMMWRSLGAGYSVAYAAQALVSLAAVGASWALWRRPAADPLARVAVMLCLVALASPYAYIYDLPGLGLVLAGVAARASWRALAAVTLFWVFTGFYVFFSAFWCLTGALFLGGILLLTWCGAGDSRSASRV